MREEEILKEIEINIIINIAIVLIIIKEHLVKNQKHEKQNES